MTNMSRASSPVSGVSGQALKFDGADGKIDVTHAASIDNLSAMTISAWVNAKSMGESSSGYIISKENNGDGGWLLTLYSTGLYFRVWYDDGTMAHSLQAYSAENTFTSADFNQWHHIIVTWDGTNLASGVKFYKDNILLSHYVGAETNGVNSRISDSTYNINIGNNYWQSRTFDGSIDDVRVYSRALSSDEVGDLYRLGSFKITK